MAREPLAPNVTQTLRTVPVSARIVRPMRAATRFALEVAPAKRFGSAKRELLEDLTPKTSPKMVVSLQVLTSETPKDLAERRIASQDDASVIWDGVRSRFGTGGRRGGKRRGCHFHARDFWRADFHHRNIDEWWPGFGSLTEPWGRF